MPLRKGKKPGNISYNIRKLMKEWEDTGMMGDAKPKTRKDALRMATAIAMDMMKK